MYARVGGPRDGANSRRAFHAHWGTLDGLRDNRGRGHNAVALMRLCFDFAPAFHRDALLDRKPVGRPAKIGL